MSFFALVVRSLRQHALSTLTTVLSLALGVGLMTAVVALRTQTHGQFTRVGLGIDAVLGPKGSPLQIVLNAVYHLEEMPGTIAWAVLEEVRRNPLVEKVVPFCSGHSFAGVRVNAIDTGFFSGFEIQPGKTLNFDPDQGGQGRAFASGPANEAVAGWEAARKLNIKLGTPFRPVCGVEVGEKVHQQDPLVFVGILARTGTPHDRAVYMPLDRFFALEGHNDEVVHMASHPENRKVSGALVKMRKIRGNLMHPGVRDLKYQLDRSPNAQLVIPAEVMPRLFQIIGWIDFVLLGIAVLVVLLASLFLVVSLLNALRERRRDYALLRCLGASRAWVFGLVLTESTIMCGLGAIAGLVVGRILLAVGTVYLQAETGVLLDAWAIGLFDLAVLPGILVLGFATGLIPAMQAYRLNVMDTLFQNSPS